MSQGVGVVLPGTSITTIVEKVLVEKKLKDTDELPLVKLGTGLIQTSDDIVAVKAGMLTFVKPNKFWVESNRQRRVIYYKL